MEGLSVQECRDSVMGWEDGMDDHLDIRKITREVLRKIARSFTIQTRSSFGERGRGRRH